MSVKYFLINFLTIIVFIPGFKALSSGSEEDSSFKIDNEFVSIGTEFDCDYDGEYLKESEYAKFDPNKRFDEQIFFSKSSKINGRDNNPDKIGKQETATILKQTRPFLIKPTNPIFLENILVFIRVTSIYCGGELITTTEGIYDFYTSKALYRSNHKQLLTGASLPLSKPFIDNFEKILNEI